MDNPSNFIWIDLEMTGLLPDKDKIIELCVMITDHNFNVLNEGINIIINQSDELLASMDDWNTKQHHKSGLVDEVKHSNINEQQAQQQVLEFLQKHVNPNTSPMCGNSVYQDRRFLSKYMPKLEAYFHYRNLDVSTLKILAQLLAPDLVKNKEEKQSNHRAKDDILESIAELKFYLDKFIKF